MLLPTVFIVNVDRYDDSKHFIIDRRWHKHGATRPVYWGFDRPELSEIVVQNEYV